MRAGDAEIPPDMRDVIEWVRKTYQYSGDSYDWVPNCRIQDEWDRLKLGSLNAKLHPIRFGVACALGFADLDRFGVGAEAVYRRITQGMRSRGWAGVTGPGGIRSPEYR